MRSLFVRDYRYLADEDSNGKPSRPRLACNLFLAAAYCDSVGLEVDSLSVVDADDYKPESYDVVAAWTPVFEGFDIHLDFLRKAKAVGKRTIMILNDPIEALEWEVAQTYEFVDVIIRHNERELTLEKVLRELENDIESRAFDFSGLIYRNEEREVVDTGKTPQGENLHHLVSTRKFLEKEPLELYDQAFIEVARGCPYPCDFCFYTATKHRARRVDDILDELELLQGRYDHIWLHDLNFLVDIEFSTQLCEAIVSSGMKIAWGTDGRVDNCAKHGELLLLMRRAGCQSITMGLESGDPETLREIHKTNNLKFMDRAIDNLSKSGIKPDFNVIIGFPWETKESLRRTWEMVKDKEISFTQFIRPLRGTPLYERFKELGVIEGELTLRDYTDCRDEPMFPTLHLSKQELIRHRDLTTLETFHGIKRIGRGIRNRVMALG